MENFDTLGVLKRAIFGFLNKSNKVPNDLSFAVLLVQNCPFLPGGTARQSFSIEVIQNIQRPD